MISGEKILFTKETLTGIEAIHLLSELIKDSVSTRDFLSFARKYDIPAYVSVTELTIIALSTRLLKDSENTQQAQKASKPIEVMQGDYIGYDDGRTPINLTHEDLKLLSADMLKGYSYTLMYCNKYCAGDIYFRLLGLEFIVESKARASEPTLWKINRQLLGGSPHLPAHFLPDDIQKLAGIINGDAQGQAWKPASTKAGWRVKRPDRTDELAESILKVLYQEHKTSPAHPPIVSEVVAELISAGVLSVKNNNRSQLYLNDSSKEPITQDAMKARIKRYIEQ